MFEGCVIWSQALFLVVIFLTFRFIPILRQSRSLYGEASWHTQKRQEEAKDAADKEEGKHTILKKKEFEVPILSSKKSPSVILIRL